MPFAAIWVQLEILILSEVIQKEKGKIPYDIIYVKSKIWHKCTYLQNRNRSWTWTADLCMAVGKGGEKGMGGEFGIDRCKVLHLEQMGNGVLPYGTENCVQSLGLEHSGRYYKKKEYVYIFMYDWVALLYSRS